VRIFGILGITVNGGGLLGPRNEGTNAALALEGEVGTLLDHIALGILLLPGIPVAQNDRLNELVPNIQQQWNDKARYAHHGCSFQGKPANFGFDLDLTLFTLSVICLTYLLVLNYFPRGALFSLIFINLINKNYFGAQSDQVVLIIHTPNTSPINCYLQNIPHKNT